MADQLQASADTVVLDRFFESIRQGYARSRTRDATEQTLRLAGRSIRLRLATRALAQALTPALAHLPAGGASADLDLWCWEGSTPDLRPPDLPWPWPAQWRQGSIFHPMSNPMFQVAAFPDCGALAMWRLDTGEAMFWVPRATDLPTYHYGSPFLKILAPWATAQGLMLAHAGCVGTERGAALLVGKGGSGKSTTSLLCALGGLKYLSDDYCLVDPTPSPMAYSLYNTGKLLREKFPAMPRLARVAQDPSADAYGKPVVFLTQVPEVQVATELPLRAIFVPRVTGLPSTTVAVATEAEALRALAPSTLFQLHNANAGAFKAMAELVRRVPCYGLSLGTRFEEIPPVVRDLLDHPA